MRTLYVYIVLGVLFGGVCATKVQAIAVADYSVAESSPTNAGYALDVAYVYNYKYATAVAVDHYWVLTAAHVGDDGGTGALVIDGVTYNQQEVIYHDTADLALVRYDKALPGYYLLNENAISYDSRFGGAGDELVMAGYGFDGTVSDSSFTQGSIAGKLRWGTNRGKGESTITLDVGGTAGSRTTTYIETVFNLTDTTGFNTAYTTDYEAGANVYDSGGAVFVQSGSEWVLAGINLYRLGTDPSWTGNYFAKLSDYVSWIKSVIVDYDTDQDFLPDWWEDQYSSGPTAMDAQADDDSDGFTNYEEWMADTDPTVGSSHFQTLEWNAPTNVLFTSSSARQYSVEYKLDLADPNEAWVTEVDWTVGADGQTALALPDSASNRAYRIRARLNY